MDTTVKTGSIKARRNFLRSVVRWWIALITIGITDQLSDWEKKRTRLLNGICWMSFIILAIYCLMYLDYKHRLTFWESFIGLVASVIPILFNYFKKHVVAAHFFCLYNLFSYSFQSISHGVVDAAEYILIPSSIASMLFFRKKLTVISYFIANGVAFALCKYSFIVMEPFLFMPSGENLFVTNHITMFVIIFLIVFYFNSENARQEKMLETKNVHLAGEKQKSDNLLLNILPEETAEELKATGEAKAKSFDSVTVMFTDFKNFTRASEKLSAVELVKEINFCYSEFDRIISECNIEKIKTIGDAYMCAGGLPAPNDTHAADTVDAAIRICSFMQKEKEKRKASGLPFFEIRVGIHTGPVIAGIVGIKKFAYDIWGDTVNIASRLETSSEVGRINISGATYQLVKDKFACTYRGKIQAKNKGEIDMYFVESL